MFRKKKEKQDFWEELTNVFEYIPIETFKILAQGCIRIPMVVAQVISSIVWANVKYKTAKYK